MTKCKCACLENETNMNTKSTFRRTWHMYFKPDFSFALSWTLLYLTLKLNKLWLVALHVSQTSPSVEEDRLWPEKAAMRTRHVACLYFHISQGNLPGNKTA